jgi:ABC-type transport system involved in multi-copper enzyme maturation permease subunit
MPMLLGPGPVFVHESIAATRRWQLYALRALFVLGLLAGLGIVGFLTWAEEGKPVGSLSLQQLARLGEVFYYTISTIQLMLVMIVAPAATAGAICLDRARGSLTHMLATDLGDAEIVLGKLAARLLPVVSLVAATVPVLALAGLLGGIIIEAIVALTLITLAVAVLGCTLALAISVRATTTHEVLMAVYAIEFAWVLSPLVWEILQMVGGVGVTPDWIHGINPFMLAWAPYAWPNYLSLEWLAGVLGGMMAISAGLTVYAVLRLRAEVTGRAGRRVGQGSSWMGRFRERLARWRPGPSLDRDPVLWREWHRSRPSRLARIVWGAFILLSLAGTASGVVHLLRYPNQASDFIVFVNGFQVTFGLLLISLNAPTVLAEERVRGSLDVLLTTPLPTDRIVLAKWWGAFRVVPALALLPAIGCLFVAVGMPDVPPGVRRFGQAPAPLDWLDRVAFVVLPTAMVLVQGAMIASVGLALATWCRRIGRAVALSVAAYGLVAFLGPILLEVVPEVLVVLGFFQEYAASEFVVEVIGSACPLFGQITTWMTSAWPPAQSRGAFYVGQVIVILATLELALIVLGLTMATFNRCVGRAPERARRAPRPRPPARKAERRGPHVRTAEGRPSGVAEPAMGAGL